MLAEGTFTVGLFSTGVEDGGGQAELGGMVHCGESVAILVVRGAVSRSWEEEEEEDPRPLSRHWSIQ